MRNAIAIMLFALLLMITLFLYKEGYCGKWVFDSVLLLAGFYIYVVGFEKYKKLRLIRDTATSKIGSLPLGLVEVCGKARRISDHGYIYHCFSMKERKSLNSGYFKSIFSYIASNGIISRMFSFGMAVERDEFITNPFYIEDDTGKVLVDPLDSEIIVDVKTWRDNDYTYSESKIEDGDYVYCLGTAKRMNSSDLVMEIRKSLNEARKDKEFVRKIDLNGDGVIDRHEWDKARREIEERIISANLKSKSVMTIEKGDSERTFVISQKSETKLMQRTFVQCLSALFVSIAVIVFAIFNIVFTK